MGRPRIEDTKKRKARSISVRQEILKMAESAKNTSVFFESSVDCCKSINDIMASTLTSEQRNEKIQAALNSWNSQLTHAEAEAS
ncbi:MAG: hypothetical protein NTX25_02365 [Proteobacteria bacterium]|nr:hypothetical protein [Pseudomonadota bacterium]